MARISIAKYFRCNDLKGKTRPQTHQMVLRFIFHPSCRLARHFEHHPKSQPLRLTVDPYLLRCRVHVKQIFAETAKKLPYKIVLLRPAPSRPGSSTSEDTRIRSLGWAD